MVAFPKGRLDCCGKFITSQLYVNQCAKTRIYGRKGEREETVGLNGKNLKAWLGIPVDLEGASITPVVKHNT